MSTADNQPTVEGTPAPSPETEKKDPVLFGIISYRDDETYEKFIENITPGQSIATLIHAVNYAQRHGIYNVRESEVLSRCIRKIKSVSTANAPKPDAGPSN